ncbi:Lysine-specific demethylase 8 [Pleurostoma richardsiae]|uniref:Lysine-specific demethylase 8 n=1 Tax=Pleurostoma richardsiae TaxID=41990 RepID=A0AA38RK10_9PEZI|nr:Lysine-specific demethylase 8 [Pleurostoma richardsiae]
MSRWFDSQQGPPTDSRPPRLTTYLEDFALIPVPYELIYPQNTKASSPSQDAVHQFCKWLEASDNPIYNGLASLFKENLPSDATNLRLVRLVGPLALILAAQKFNQEGLRPLTQLYIAQAPVSDLPSELQDDLPTPRLVKEAGKGDVYDTSIWLGLEPTYTPWHRDPNPNLFCQLCSSKIVRLSSPSVGDSIYRDVQMQLGRHGSSRIRGEEMMQGPERQALQSAIWGPGSPSTILEVRVEPGDALFIPKGWWHSVKSAFSDGRLNGSVNWWFR